MTNEEMKEGREHRCYGSRINEDGIHVCDICKRELPTPSQVGTNYVDSRTEEERRNEPKGVLTFSSQGGKAGECCEKCDKYLEYIDQVDSEPITKGEVHSCANEFCPCHKAGEGKEWDEEWDSMFNWADQIIGKEIDRWKLMYGFTPDELKAWVHQKIAIAEARGYERGYTKGKGAIMSAYEPLLTAEREKEGRERLDDYLEGAKDGRAAERTRIRAQIFKVLDDHEQQ